MFFQKEIETMKRSELEALQLERLKWTVDYCYKNVPFYTKKLDEAGISADKIKSLSDIKYIPPTTKADLRDNYPFGLFARPMKEMVRIHASSAQQVSPQSLDIRSTTLICGRTALPVLPPQQALPTKISFRYLSVTACSRVLWVFITDSKNSAQRLFPIRAETPKRR